MRKNKIKIITTIGPNLDFKKYLLNNLKKRKVSSHYSIIMVNDAKSLQKELLNANVIITNKWTNKILKAPDLKLLQIPAAGYDNIHFPSIPSGCNVCNIFEHEAPIAEYCILAMLESEIKLFKMNSLLKKGDWTGYFSNSGFHGELLHKELAIIGYGHIGKEIYKRAQSFGMKTTAVVRNIAKYKNNNSKKLTFLSIKNIQKYLNNFDYLIVACPLNNETENLISHDFIKNMKKSSVIINIARGPIINEKALYIALKNKSIRGAIIDVWYQYPKVNNPKKLWPSKFPLHKLENIYMSAHMSAWTHQLWERRFEIITKNIENLRNGRKLINIIKN